MRKSSRRLRTPQTGPISVHRQAQPFLAVGQEVEVAAHRYFRNLLYFSYTHIAGLFYLFVSLYQLAVHTEINWSLGPLNHIIYTPAAHRSHHANVRPESDRNLGGFFIIFDRLFGTYTPTRPHDRPPEYGLPGGQARTFKEAAFGELFRFFRAFRARDGLAKRLRFALTRPLTSPDETTHPSG